MKKLIVALAISALPLLASCGSDDTQANLEQEVAEQEATIESRDDDIAGLEQEVADQAATIEARDDDIADLEGEVADQAATIQSLEDEIAALQQQAAEQTADDSAAEAVDSSEWVAALESNIEAGLNEQWAGQYEDHSVSCPAVDLQELAAGDEFTCDADCQCVPDPTSNITPTDIKVVYDGNLGATWEEILASGNAGPGPDGAPASGTFAG